MSLGDIARELRDEQTVISDHVVEPSAHPVLGTFVALGPRCKAAPREYALVVESVREGYLLHYGEPRVVVGADEDLALLAGDHLYALGLERLARLGDLGAVRELADLISLCALLGAEGREDADALWIASAAAIAAGGSPEHEAAKAALRRREVGAAAALRAAAREQAEEAGVAERLEETVEGIESGADVSA
jgi:hypothetical protein